MYALEVQGDNLIKFLEYCHKDFKNIDLNTLPANINTELFNYIINLNY